MTLVQRAGKVPLLAWVVIAILAGILLGQVLPEGVIRVFATYNSIFSSLLGFAVPLIILALTTPAIADLGMGAGRWLAITVAIAYGSTIFSGLMTYLVALGVLPRILVAGQGGRDVADPSESMLAPYFTLDIPPAFGVMTALVLAFVVGVALAARPSGVLQRGFEEFRDVITAFISKVIIPLLPLHIFGIFLNMTHSGEAVAVVVMFGKIVVVALILHVVLLLIQYAAAGAIARRNPLRALVTMLPAYATALGTSSSAATIPVTLARTKLNGVSTAVADFVIPLCATIHLAGSTMKITLFSMGVMVMYGQDLDAGKLIPFIFMLGVMMVAAPGVPGGAIMAAIGILQSMLGFDETMVAMMVATYIAIDSVGTATNVTGDGAIALVVDKLAKGRLGPERLDGEIDREVDGERDRGIDRGIDGGIDGGIAAPGSHPA